jgi:hypothetical protein
LRAGENVSLDDLEKAFNATVIQVPWLLSFYELPSNVKIASSQLYKEGKIYGIDLSSGKKHIYSLARPCYKLLILEFAYLQSNFFLKK